MNRLAPVAAVVAAASVFAGVACSDANTQNPGTGGSSQNSAQTAPANTSSRNNTTATTTGMTAAELVKFAEPAVVRIASGSSVGSGFVVSEDGYIITNNHVVVGNSTRARATVGVTLSDGSEYEANVVGTDPRSDLALLKIDASTKLTALPLADLDNVAIGEDVVAIGYALDLAQGEGPSFTVTRGIVSQKNRSISETSPIMGAVQTDAAINHGNSGGPLLNMKGEVVGVNTALQPDLTTGEPAQGIGYAVGSDTVRAVFEELKQDGQVSRGLLGVANFESLRPATARKLGLPEDTKGVYLPEDTASVPAGPAQAAGIQPGDVITKIEGQTIASEGDLAVAMIRHAPGETVTVEIYRSGKKQEIKVTLGTP